MAQKKKNVLDTAGAAPQGSITDPNAIASALNSLVEKQFATQEQKLTAALGRPENIRLLEAKLSALLSTTEGKAQIADLLYGAGSLELAKAVEGQPLAEGWISDIKKAGSTNVKMWHVPLYALGAGTLYVIAKRLGWTDTLSEMLGID